jgi:hypothetical protein
MNDPEYTKRLFEETVQQAKEMQLKYGQAAQACGQIAQITDSAMDFWVQVAQYSNQDPSYGHVLESGTETIYGIKQALGNVASSFPSPTQDLRSVALSVCTFGSNTAATGSYAPFSTVETLTALAKVLPDAYRDDSLAHRFSKLDPALGKTCAEVWETLHGTTSAPEQSALYMMRQTWDHLFDQLAPDSEVRKSPFWKKKDGPKPELVTRSERINFAAMNCIKDKTKQNLLLSSRDQMIVLYDNFNSAHKRGEINKDKAVKTLAAVYDWLLQWADALEL